MKRCWKCGETKPYDHFHRDKHRADGYTYRCKACTKAYNAERYSENAPTVRAKQRSYYAERGGWLREVRAERRAERRPAQVKVPSSLPRMTWPKPTRKVHESMTWDLPPVNHDTARVRAGGMMVVDELLDDVRVG